MYAPDRRGLSLGSHFISGLLVAIFLSLGLGSLATQAQAYEKATEGQDVVMRKLFPKRKRLQIESKGGLILNQSYLNTFLVNGTVSYFFNEEWGMSAEANMAVNIEKGERGCIESFYNDPEFVIGDECGPDVFDQDSSGLANWGPAYVPIRELKYIIGGNLIWNPVYGKQIVLLSATNYFDVYVTMGGGVAFSDYYALQNDLPDGREARGSFSKEDRAGNPGTKDENEIGLFGRPIPESQSSILASASVGQRFHFLERFMVTAELKNYLLIGTDAGFDTFFSLSGGLGMRF